MKTIAMILTLILSLPAFGRSTVICQAPLLTPTPKSNLGLVKRAVRLKKSQSKILSLAMKLNESERVQYAGWLLQSPELSGLVSTAILAAHRVGMERGYFKYTREDLRAKVALLKGAGLTRASDRRRLMENGAVGGLPVETEVSISRYNVKIRLTDERELEAYAQFILQAMEFRIEKPSLAQIQEMIESLKWSGRDYEEAGKMVASFFFDETKYDSKAEKVIEMFKNKSFGSKPDDWQRDGLNFLLEKDRLYASDAAPFLRAIKLEDAFADFVVKLLEPPDLISHESDAVDQLLKGVETLEREHVSATERSERWAIYTAIEMRRSGGSLSGREAEFAEALLIFSGVNQRSVWSIMNLLKRDYERELEEKRREHKEGEEHDEDEMEEALEFLLMLFGLK